MLNKKSVEFSRVLDFTLGKLSQKLVVDSEAGQVCIDALIITLKIWEKSKNIHETKNKLIDMD